MSDKVPMADINHDLKQVEEKGGPLALRALRADLRALLADLARQTAAGPGTTLVLGASSSELSGGRIGKASNEELALVLLADILDFTERQGWQLAVQCCEHLNRAMVVERELAQAKAWREVTAVPALHAGGAFALAAWRFMRDPILVERVEAEVGLDLGATGISHAVARVQIPLRLLTCNLGPAQILAFHSRPPKIGGERARYALTEEKLDVSQFLAEHRLD